MALLYRIEVKEDAQTLSKLYRQTSLVFRPRIRMLQLIEQGICSTKELSQKTKASADRIGHWKKQYAQGGIDALTEEKRGMYQRGAISPEQHTAIEKRLSEPKEGFTSYIAARTWINATFGLEMQYQAVNKYLKRNFHTKLKVGRKSHVQKDGAVETAFKKAW